MPDVLYIHPAKHDVDTGFQDLGYYSFIPVGVVGLVNLLRREGLEVKGINYPAELLRNRAFRQQRCCRKCQSIPRASFLLLN